MKKLIYSSLLVVGVTVAGYAAIIGGGTCFNTFKAGDQWADVCMNQNCENWHNIDTSVGTWTNCGSVDIGVESIN